MILVKVQKVKRNNNDEKIESKYANYLKIYRVFQKNGYPVLFL